MLSEAEAVRELLVATPISVTRPAIVHQFLEALFRLEPREVAPVLAILLVREVRREAGLVLRSTPEARVVATQTSKGVEVEVVLVVRMETEETEVTLQTQIQLEEVEEVVQTGALQVLQTQVRPEEQVVITGVVLEAVQAAPLAIMELRVQVEEVEEVQEETTRLVAQEERVVRIRFGPKQVIPRPQVRVLEEEEEAV